jgi:hypothetical protein
MSSAANETRELFDPLTEIIITKRKAEASKAWSTERFTRHEGNLCLVEHEVCELERRRCG